MEAVPPFLLGNWTTCLSSLLSLLADLLVASSFIIKYPLVKIDQPISLLVSGPQPASPGAGDPRGWRTSEAANGNPGISARSQRGKPYNPVFANWVSFRLLRVRLHPRDPPPPAPRSRGIRPLLAGSAPTHAPFSQGCRRSWKPRQIQRSRTDPIFQKFTVIFTWCQ